MKSWILRHGALLCSVACFCSSGPAEALDIPLGGIGGIGDIVPGTGLVSVTSVTAGGPGALAGLQPGDLIQGAYGIPFSNTSTDSGSGFVGAVQDLAMAVDRAEGTGGALALQVIRSGLGGITLNLNLSPAGTLGPAWPANNGKTSAMFEWSCDQIHSKVQASSSADFGYNSGWFGMILLAHPDWNQTSGSNPFRNSINKLRTRCENYINGRVLEPAEAFFWNGSDVVANPAYVSPGLENWDVCSSAMFLALYRSKTGDTTANAVVQRAAEAIAHRIQHWQQYDDPGAPHVFGGGIGRMGHGGVHGDYSHYNGTGALNIINAHALPALALLKNAGANMNTNLGLSINAFTYNPGLVQPTIEQKFRICWDYVKAATSVGGSDDGNVGYVGTQSGWDSAGRTPGCFAGWKLYGMAATADDTDKAARQADYFTRRWFRQQHAHAYTLGGVALSQLAMPFLDDRRERFFQENTRLYPALARKPDGSIAYFPGRQNNGGDSYLDYNNVALVNAAIPIAIRTGNLPGFPTPNPARIHAWMRSPANSWPAIEARRVVLTGGLSHTLDLDITDVDGNILAPGAYTAAWSHVSGPSAVAFGSPTLADTTVTVSQAGTYRVNLQVIRGAYVLNEPYDLVVSNTPPPADVTPYVVSAPTDFTADQGDSVTFTVTAQGTAPLVYQWRRNGVAVGSPATTPSYTIGSVSAGSAGEYDCVITNAAGTVTSATATLTVNGIGTFRWGGLWCDVFTGISGSSVSNLTTSANYPSFPNTSGVITTAESPSSYADNYGQRWSGWITPPETGNYRFYIACDDNAELWISTDDKRANRVLRARETGWRASRSWPTSNTDESVSPQLALVAGQRYYIELLHKEGGGGDNAAITWNWQSPGVWGTPAAGSAPLPGAVLEYQEGGTLDDVAHPPSNYAPIAQSQALVVFGGAFTDILLAAEDFEDSLLTYTITTNPTKGTLSGTAPNVVYTPLPGASGVDSFTFVANDGSLNSEPATVTLSLVPETSGDIKVWNGSTDTLWSTAANWNAAAVPDSNDAIIFNSDSLSNLTTSLDGNRTIARVVVLDPAGAVSISNNTLTLSGGIEMLPASANLTIASAVTLSAPQEWSVGNGRTLLASGALGGSSSLTKTGAGTLEISAAGSLTGGIIVNGGILRLSGGGWYGGLIGGSGMLTVNSGATAVNVNAHSFGSSENPDRDITLNGGSFLLAAETYVDDVTTTAGTIGYTVGGGGDFRSRTGNNSVLTVNAAAQPTVVSAAFNAVGTWSINVANGAASHDLVISGPLAGGSSITKNGAGRMLVSSTSTHTGTFNLAAGELAVTGSLATASALTVQSGATLSGTGTIQGTVTHNGILSPGIDGIAVLNLGALNQSGGSSTQITLGGTNPGSGYDQVAVAGAATLAGTLQVSLAPGFVPTTGSVFDVVTSTSRSGTFATISLPALPTDRKWSTIYNGGSTAGLRLTVDPATYTLTYAAGPNGSVSGTTSQTVNHGASATAVTAVPNTGYRFVSWSDGVSTATRTDTNIQANLSVTANFAILQYSVTYAAGPNGSVSGTTSQTVNHGASATAVTAVPNTGYRFVSWSDGVSTATRTDTNIQANLSVTANFTILQYAVTYTAGPNGSVSGTTSQTVNHGASATAVTAVPNPGYRFVSWSDGVSTATRTDTNVQANLSVTANFTILQYSVTYAAGPNGSVSGTTSQTVNHGSDATAVTAVPDTGYHFVSWSDGVLTAARIDTNILANLSVTANFAINEYGVTYSAGANGTISGIATQTVQHGSSATTVTAVPDAGYHFVSWSDGVLTAARTDTNILANLSVTANFAINEYSVTYAAGANGAISGNAAQTVQHGFDAQPVTAIADSGAFFVSWSDGVLTPTRHDTQVTAALTLTATFQTGTGPVSVSEGSWASANTWNHNLPAPVSGTQGQGLAYQIDGHTVSSHEPSALTQAWIGSSVTVQNGGAIVLRHSHSDAISTAVYDLPPVSMSAGTSLVFDSTDNATVHQIAASLHATGSIGITLTGSDHTNEVRLAGPVTGTGTIAVDSGSDAAETTGALHGVAVLSSANPYTGNWSVEHTAAGDDFTFLRADAANALGSGTITLGNRAILINNHPNGIDSLGGVVMTGGASQLDLLHSWNNQAATLALSAGSPRVRLLGDSSIVLKSLAGPVGIIEGSGPASSLTIMPDNPLSFGGSLTGNLALIHAGTAEFLLVGANNHSGPTTVTSGTLAGTGSGQSALTVSSGATLAPGNGIGTFAASTAEFANGSSLRIEINTSAPTADRLAAANVTIGSPVALHLEDIAPGTPANGTKFPIIDYTGHTLTGTFAGIEDGSTITVGANSFVVDYHDTLAGTGDFVTLTVVSNQTPYETWIDSFPSITGLEDKSPGADPENDGLTNSIEFVIGSNPAEPTAGAALSTTADEAAIVFQYNRVKTAVDAGFIPVVELCEDPGLAAWAPADPELITVTDHGTTESVRVTVPLVGGPDRMFARLRVTAP